MDQCELLQLEFLIFCSVPAALDFGDNVLLSGDISSNWPQLTKLRKKIKKMKGKNGCERIQQIIDFSYFVHT